MNRKIVQALWETLQLIALLILLPFHLFSRFSYWLFRFAEWTQNNLGRPVYYGVVQAKRRYLKMPLWQEQDWMIGIGPPCEHCGVQVPPNIHSPDCAFLKPARTLLPIEIAALAHASRFRRDTPLDIQPRCAYCNSPTMMFAYTDLEMNLSYPPCCARSECIDQWTPTKNS